MNTDSAYWDENYPHTVAALSGVTGDDSQTARHILATIAGDHAAMTDDEVIATFINENAPETQQ